MLKKFYKMHGIGNDYIYFDCMEEELPAPNDTAVRLSDRHFSVGGDGIVMICKSGCADAKMRMFNADGSEGKMCGNAIRCVGKFLYEIKGVHKDTLEIETLSGIKKLFLHIEGGKVSSVTVDMGRAVLRPDEIPVLWEGDTAVAIPLEVGGATYRATCVSMGNPHCVVFEDPDGIEIEKIGKLFEHNRAFPDRVNTEFVKVLERNKLKMRVWERGSGETLACGTGACASAVAAVLNGYCDEGAEIKVLLRGGELSVKYTKEAVYMTGGAELAFTGEAEI